VEFLGAARGLLDEVAIFDGHADLVAEGEKKAEFGGSEAAIVGSAEEKEAEGLFLGLETDDDDAAEAVLEGEFAEAAKRLARFKRGEVCRRANRGNRGGRRGGRRGRRDSRRGLLPWAALQKSSGMPAETTEVGPEVSP